MTEKFLNSRYAPPIAVFLISAAVYANSLANGFVYDDNFVILENPWIKDVRNIPSFFFSDVWGYNKEMDSSYYRPIMGLLNMLDYYLYGHEDAWGHHLTNLLLQGAVSVTVLVVGRSLFLKAMGEGPARGASFMAAILFATHPIHTMVVAWSGAIEMVLTAFVLLSVYFYMKGRRVLSVGFFILACLSKETGIVVPILLIAFDTILAEGRLLRDGVKGLIKRYLPYAAAGACYLTLRGYALGEFAPAQGASNLYESLINVFYLFAKYMWITVVPVGLNVAHDFHPITSLFGVKGLASLTVAVAFVAAVLATHRRAPLVSFLLVWIGVPLLPVLYFPMLGNFPFAENYLYMSSFGFVLLTAWGFWHMGEWAWSGGRMRNAAAVLFIVLVVVYSAETVNRNKVWRDELSLWSDSVKKLPENHMVRNNLGQALNVAGRPKEAVAEFDAAIRVKPDFIKAHNNRALAYLALGDIDGAAAGAEYAATLDPENAIVRNNLGTMYLCGNFFWGDA